MKAIAFRTTAALPAKLDARNPKLFANSTTLRFDIIRDEARFLELAPVWDSLLEQSPSQSRFLHWDWMSLWWAEHRDKFELTVGVVRNLWHQPVAIAPLVIGYEESGTNPLKRHIELMGRTDDIASQTLDFIIPRGQEAVLAPILCRVFSVLRSRWDVTRLHRIPDESPNMPYIFEALQNCSNQPDASGVGTR
jgi:hypothetical protein